MFTESILNINNQDSLHDCMTDNHHSIPGKGKAFFCSPKRPDRLWGPASLLFIGYWQVFPCGKAVGAWNLPLSPSSAKDKSYVSAHPRVVMTCKWEILLYVLGIRTWYRSINMIRRESR